MLIVCPNCSTSYEIDISKLAPRGRSVRCARCQQTWFAASPVTLPEEGLAWEPAPLPRPASPAAGEAAEVAVADADDAVPEDAPALPALIEDAPPLAPSAAAIEPAEPAGEIVDAVAEPVEPQEDIETAALRRARIASERVHRRRRRARVPLAILALAAVLAALVGWRTHVVRFAPQTAQIYRAIGLPVNLRGLEFADIRISDETQDGVPVMVVQGRIANTARQTVEVPRLRFAVRNAAGIEVYAWTALPEQPFLSPGESQAFRSRLASPPADAKDVLVRFFHRRDLVAGGS